MTKKLLVNISNKRFRKSLKRRRKVRKRKMQGLIFNYVNFKSKISLSEKIKVPKFFNYLEYPLDCNYFFNQIRTRSKCNFIKGKVFYKICFQNTIDIDFAAVSILKSIMEEASLSGISFSGNLPKNPYCKEKLIQFGFLNNLNHNGNMEIKSSGEYLSYKKKSGKITINDYRDFDSISAKAHLNITGIAGHFDELITVFKEIGSNAVEWSHSKGKQWMIGFYEDEDKVIINVTDLGKGILETLFRAGRLQFIDFFSFRGSMQFLERAFQRKYGSLSQEVNRNRGLPFIKKTYDDKKFKNLVVSTNDIFYNFEQKGSCVNSYKSATNFSGTFYQWEIDKQCVKYYD